MAVAVEGFGRNLSQTFGSQARATFSAGTNASRAILAFAFQESDNTPTTSNIQWNSNALTLGSDHDPTIPVGSSHSKYGSAVSDSTITSGSNNLDNNMSSGAAKPRIMGVVLSGVSSMQNQAYVDLASNNSLDVVVTGTNGDTAVVLIFTDGNNAITCASGGTVFNSQPDVSGAYGCACVTQAITSGGTTTVQIRTTGPAATWSGAKASVTPAATGIAVDAAGNSGDQAAASSYSGSASWSGTNRLLAIDVSMLGPGVTVSSMTYGGAACTLVGALSTLTSFGRIEQWRIVSSDSGAPAAGANTLAVTLSGSLEFTVEWASYTGVHQTVPVESFNSVQATNAGSATDASVAITTIADNCWVHAGVVANDTSIAAGNTTRNNIAGTLGSGANEDNGAAKTPAGSVTMSYSGMGITTTWAIAGYAIRPIAASGASNFFSFNPPLRGGMRHLAGNFQGG